MKPPDKAIARPPVPTGLRIARFVAKAIIPIALIVGGVVGYRVLNATTPALETSRAVERVWPVEAATVRIARVQPTIIAYGTLQAGREVDLRPLVGGEVMGLGAGFEDGGEVSAGATLIEIDPFDYETALAEARANLTEADARIAESNARIALEESSLANARAQLEIAERDLERAVALQGRGALSDRTLDERRLTVEQRRQQIIQNESMIAIERSRRDQQQAALDRLAVVVSRAERDLSNTTLRAPFDGIVAGPDAEIGRLVSANDHVATLYARGGSEVRFTLTEADYAGLVASGESLIGRPINVVWSANGTLAPFPAEISRIAPEIDASRGSVALYADLSVEPEALRPGAFVEVRVQDRVYDDVAALPQTALYGTGTVYVIVDGRLLPRAVEVVGRDSGTLLLSGDLADGDDVLVSRITEAGDGLAVDIVARP